MKKIMMLRNGQEIIIKTLTINELGPILELQEKVMGSLEVSSFLQPLSEEEFRNILNGNGAMIGAFYGNRLIAFRAMLEPEIDEFHLGRDAGLPETELPTVLYSEVTNVDPDYRGNKLQQHLGEILMETVDKNRYRYVCATVAPFNIASLKDKFALGMHIVSVEKKYGNMLRYTFIKDLSASDKPATIGVTVDMSDVMAQQSLLADGWVGVGLEQVDDSWKVKYAKKA